MVNSTGTGPSLPVGNGGPVPSPGSDAQPATVPSLGPDWLPGPDGLPFRTAARVLLLDEQDRVLLVRGHDVDQPERSWWFTVGGGLEPGESAREGAVREVFEETGLVLDPAGLIGPVWSRSAIFDFLLQRCRQDEEFFLARVDGAAELMRDGWTELEAAVLDEMRWWPVAELDAVQIEVFPAGLAALIRPLLTGWDGVTRQVD